VKAHLRHDLYVVGAHETATHLEMVVHVVDPRGVTVGSFKQTAHGRDGRFNAPSRIPEIWPSLVGPTRRDLVSAFRSVREDASRESREGAERRARAEAERVAKAREEAERKAREEAERLAKRLEETEQAARERAARDSRARSEAQREVQDRAEREAKAQATGLGDAGLDRRRPAIQEAMSTAAHAEAAGDAGAAFRAYERAWLAIYRADDPEVWERVEVALLRVYPKLPARPALREEARRHEVQGDVFFDAQRFDKAIEAYARLLALAPWYQVGRFNLAVALAAEQRYGEAIRHMRAYLALVPDAPNARQARDRIYEWEARAQ